MIQITKHKRTFTVFSGADFYGTPGYSCDGWCGATPEEAVLERLLNEGLSDGEAFDIAVTAEISVERA